MYIKIMYIKISYHVQYICFHDPSYVYAWMEESLVSESAKSGKMPFLPNET